MEEIIAKSKAAKRMKAKEKEEDDDKLEALDDAFKSLSKARRDNSRLSKGASLWRAMLFLFYASCFPHSLLLAQHTLEQCISTQ